MRPSRTITIILSLFVAFLAVESCGREADNLVEMRYSFRNPGLVVQRCRERLRGRHEVKCVDHYRRFRCGDQIGTPVFLTLGRIHYCVSTADDQISLQRDFKVVYRTTSTSLTESEMKRRVADGLAGMTKLYDSYGIRLEIKLSATRDSDPPKWDFIVQDNLNAGANMFRIPLGIKEKELTPDEFGLLFSHEVSHHLGLPDRYKSESCPQGEVSGDSLMGHLHESGLEGMKLSNDDLVLLLEPLCGTEP